MDPHPPGVYNNDCYMCYEDIEEDLQDDELEYFRVQVPRNYWGQVDSNGGDIFQGNMASRDIHINRITNNNVNRGNSGFLTGVVTAVSAVYAYKVFSEPQKSVPTGKQDNDVTKSLSKDQQNAVNAALVKAKSSNAVVVNNSGNGQVEVIIGIKSVSKAS